MLPALPTEKPRANKLTASSLSRMRVSYSVIGSALQHAERFQEEVGRAEIARFQREHQVGPTARGERPRHAGIDLGTDAERAHAKPPDDCAGGFSAGNDDLAHAARDQP